MYQGTHRRSTQSKPTITRHIHRSGTSSHACLAHALPRPVHFVFLLYLVRKRIDTPLLTILLELPFASPLERDRIATNSLDYFLVGAIDIARCQSTRESTRRPTTVSAGNTLSSGSSLSLEGVPSTSQLSDCGLMTGSIEVGQMLLFPIPHHSLSRRAPSAPLFTFNPEHHRHRKAHEYGYPRQCEFDDGIT